MSEKLKRLNPKVQQYTIGDGGIPYLTSEDIAGAMGMIKHIAAPLFGRVYVNQEWEWLRDLERLMLIDVAGIAAQEGWRIHKKGIMRSLVRLAILETCAPPLCPQCNGVHTWRRGGRDIVCPRATGEEPTCINGRFRISQRTKAEATGLHHKSWIDTWSARYERDILPICGKYQAILIGGLKKRLGD